MLLSIEEAELIIGHFSQIVEEKKVLRKRLFKFMRQNIDELPPSWSKEFLSRKMNGNYLGDLKDDDVIFYSKMINEERGKLWNL